MHFKDNPNYLGEGKIDMEAVLRAFPELVSMVLQI